MRILPSLCATLVIAVAACPSSLPTSRSLGVFSVKDTSDGGGGYVTRPTAVFWQAFNLPGLPYSAAAPDSCIDEPYVQPDTTTATLANQLDAGSPIQAQSSLATIQMTPDTIPGKLIVYRGPIIGLAHVPGADIIFSVPGASGGYQAMVQHALTAKKLILGPIDPQPADSTQLTWVAGSAGNTAAVNIQLFHSARSHTAPDSMMICSMVDDGAFWLNKSLAAKWRAAFGFYQTVRAYRWVTTYTSGPNNTLLLTIAEFDTVKTTFP